MKTKLLLLGMAFILFSCGSGNQNAKNDQKETSDTAVKPKGETVSTPKTNVDSMVKVIDTERKKIEDNIKSYQKQSLSTSNLRAQIKQKWSKIDYYSENGQIVRINSIPYEKISERTEEFYFQKGKLMLAVIEDEGMKLKGKPDEGIGKAYYFFDDNVLKEDNRTTEKETTIRTSDGERLLQEAKEYLELLPKK